MLALVNPDAYGQQFLKWDEYRCFPQQWLLYSPADKKDQFNILRELLKTKYDTLYHCGDADREGQLLIDEILQYCGYKGTVKRILINSKDNTGLKRAFDSIEDNRNYQNLLLAGLAREQWDWLIGFNLTRCATVCARRFGYRNTWNIGGVKTPTLALVVNREREIQNFKKTNYFTLKAFFRKDNISFNAMWQPGDSVPQDPEGRVLDRSIADMIRKKVENHDGIVVTVEKKKEHPNRPCLIRWPRCRSMPVNYASFPLPGRWILRKSCIWISLYLIPVLTANIFRKRSWQMHPVSWINLQRSV